MTTLERKSLVQLRRQYALDVKRFGQPVVSRDPDSASVEYRFNDQLNYLVHDNSIERQWLKDGILTVTFAMK